MYLVHKEFLKYYCIFFYGQNVLKTDVIVKLNMGREIVKRKLLMLNVHSYLQLV